MKCNNQIFPGLVVVEGIDGAGTTTLVKGIQKILSERKIALYSGFEPTDGLIGKIIRQVLGGEVYFQPDTMAMLFAADRNEHLYGRGGIVSLIKTGGSYITDRYIFSSLAYQSMDVDWEKIVEMNKNFPLPEKLFFLDIPVEIAMQRINKRSAEIPDLYESTEFLRGVTLAYQKAIATYENCGMQVFRMDACRPSEELVDEAVQLLLK